MRRLVHIALLLKVLVDEEGLEMSVNVLGLFARPSVIIGNET